MRSIAYCCHSAIQHSRSHYVSPLYILYHTHCSSRLPSSRIIKPAITYVVLDVLERIRMQMKGLASSWLCHTNVRPGDIPDHLISRLHIPLAFNYPSIWECHLPTNLSLLIMENANTQKMAARDLCSATHKITICFRANECTYTRCARCKAGVVIFFNVWRLPYSLPLLHCPLPVPISLVRRWHPIYSAIHGQKISLLMR